MIMSQLPRYTEFIFQATDVFTTFLMLLLYIFPSILKFAVPVSLLLSCSIVIMRMSSDRELEVWLSSGVSVLRLCATPCALGVIVAFISLLSALFFEPYSNQQFDKFRWLQTQSFLEMVLKNAIREKVFVYDFPLPSNMKFSIYSNRVSEQDSKLSDVFLAMGQTSEIYSSVISSQSGSLNKVMTNGYPDFLFSLFNGTAYYYQPDSKSASAPSIYPAMPNWSITHFSQMDLSLTGTFKDQFKLKSTMENSQEQLYPDEYIHMLKGKKQKNANWKKDIDVIQSYLFFLKQISIPLSTFFLPIIGVCLGILDPRKKQISVYLGIGVVIFILYASITVCQQLALQFIISPYWVLFATPAILFALSCVFLQWRFYHPPSTGFIQFVKNSLQKRS